MLRLRQFAFATEGAMACENETAVVLREAGQKVTPQRVHILCEVRHAGVHITASRIIDELRVSHPFVDASTVYRTLASAADLGLVYETDMGSGESEFEWVGKDRHHHLICRTCGDVTSLDNSYLDGVATLLYEEAGFQADLGHFAIFGLCKGCQTKA
jgi:Fur family ferric uptake transcriptional regulator